MPDDPKWSWCNDNRNKVHKKCNALESSSSHSLTRVHGKLSSIKPDPSAKKFGDRCSGPSTEGQLPSFLSQPSFHQISDMFWLVSRKIHGHLQRHLKPTNSPFSETFSEVSNISNNHFSDMTKLAEILGFPSLLSPPNFNISFLLNISLKFYFNNTLSYSQNLLNYMEE